MTKDTMMYSYCKILKSILIIICLLFSSIAQQLSAQNKLTFIITSIPANTPKGEPLCLVTSFENWVPDQNKTFKRSPDGNYRLTIDIDSAKSFDYKINRGDWRKPEGNRLGGYLANRKFNLNDSVFEIRLKVESWEDLHQSSVVHLAVTSLPDNTPQDASIFVAGNFNNWVVNDSTCKLMRGTDGIYRVDIHIDVDTLIYKFSRGTWGSAECRWDGGIRSNRLFYSKRTSENIIINDLYDWNDLSTKIEWLNGIFIFLLLHVIILTIFLFRFYKQGFLIALTCIFSLAILAKYFSGITPSIRFLPVISYPFLTTGLFIWLRQTMNKGLMKLNYFSLTLFLPAFFFIFSLLLIKGDFYLKIVNNELVSFFFCSYAYALCLHFFVNFKLNKILKTQTHGVSELKLNLYRAFQVNLYVSNIIFIIALFCIWQKIEVKFIMDWLDHLLWLGLGAAVVYFEWSFLFGLISDFMLKEVRASSKETDEIEKSEMDQINSMKSKLIHLMEKQAIYTNPGLKLSDVAKYLGTNEHYVSKLINEEFERNFTDYINAFRIEAFIQSMKNDKEDNTILHHAFKVGFNSKSAFNRAFRKITNATPSEYFSQS